MFRMNQTYSYEITPPAPYRFDYFRERLNTSSNAYLYRFSDRCIARAHILNGHPVLVECTIDERVAHAPSVRLDITGAPDEQTARQATAIWRHMLSLDRSLLPFYEKMQGDAVMAEITERLSGLNLLLDATPFDSMISAIIGQQVNLTFAENLKRSLVELCGQKYVAADGDVQLAFPTPEAIARLNYEDLRARKYSQRKAEYVIDFSRGVVNGEIDLDALEGMSNDEAIDSLSKLRGIGRWTAECVLLFGLGRPDLLPAADIGLRNSIQLYYGWDRQPSEAEVREMAAPWQGYESYVTYYLWTALGLSRAEAKLQKKKRKS